MFKILHTNGKARRGEFKTVHGVVQTHDDAGAVYCSDQSIA